MAMLDKGLLQRMVGALVLIALAVIFVPMLFNREDDLRHVTVDAPTIPAITELQAVDRLELGSDLFAALGIEEDIEPATGRSEERRVGTECVSKGRSRGWP